MPSTQTALLAHLWPSQSSTFTSHRPPSNPVGQWHLRGVRFRRKAFLILGRIQCMFVTVSKDILTHISRSRKLCKSRHCHRGSHSMHLSCTGTLARGSQRRTDIHTADQGLTYMSLRSDTVECNTSHTLRVYHLVLSL